MRYLPLTLPTPAENLALDEALLVGEAMGTADTLRIWESPAPMVVVGRASRVEEEVDTEACRRLGVPVLRRASGGATIVCGPGCLMYAVTLDTRSRPHLQAVDECHREVLDPIATQFRAIEPTLHRAGTSDLAYQATPDSPARKFSGNSLRVTRGRLLYHGTLLYDFDTELVTTLLKTPPRQPDYRQARSHADFVDNLAAKREQLVKALQNAWKLDEPTTDLSPSQQTEVAQLVDSRYATDAWNLSR